MATAQAERPISHGELDDGRWENRRVKGPEEPDGDLVDAWVGATTSTCRAQRGVARGGRVIAPTPGARVAASSLPALTAWPLSAGSLLHFQGLNCQVAGGESGYAVPELLELYLDAR